MAKLLSELERFEQEMKDLGSEPSSTPTPPAHLVARVPLPPPPPPPHRPTPGSVISSPPIAASSVSIAQPSSSLPTTPAPGPLPPSSTPLFIPQSPIRPPTPIPSAAHSLPLKPPSLPPLTAPPPSIGQVNSTPWLVSATSAATVSSSAAMPTSATPQFTYSTPGLSYPPPPPALPAPSSVTSAHSTSYFPVPFHLQQQNHIQQQPQYQQQQQYVQYQPQQQYQQQPQQTTVVQAPQYTYQAVYQAPIPAADIFSLPQQQQAQQLFQRDAQTITPEALESVKAALASGDNEHKAETKKKAIPRKAAGQNWEDPTLADWPENDHRLFCGDLGNEVNDEVLTKAFSRFTAFNMARVVRDKRTGKTKGYGFVSFATPSDLALAYKEMNGKYVGNRPIKLRKSTWKDRTDLDALEKQKNNKRSKSSKRNVLHK